MAENRFDEYYDAVVVDAEGEKVGDVGQVFVDENSGQPTWVTVKTGLFGFKESFVPLVAAELVGGELRLPYTKEVIKDAPRADPNEALTEGDEAALQAYYSEDENASEGGVDPDGVPHPVPAEELVEAADDPVDAPVADDEAEVADSVSEEAADLRGEPAPNVDRDGINQQAPRRAALDDVDDEDDLEGAQDVALARVDEASLADDPIEEDSSDATDKAAVDAAHQAVLEEQRPNTEQPNTEQPNTEQPNTEQPNTEQPNTEQPSIEQQAEAALNKEDFVEKDVQVYGFQTDFGTEAAEPR